MNNNKKNDLLYVCSLIEYISRVTKNHRRYIVNKIGIDGIEKIYENAPVNHCLSFEQVSSETIKDYNIKTGNFDSSNFTQKIPSYISIGGVYKRLVLNLNNKNICKTIYDVFNSFISDEISNFDSDLYYQNPSYILECYKEGKIII